MELELLTKVTWNTSITSSNVALFVHVLLFVFLGWGGVELTLFEFKKNARTSEVKVFLVTFLSSGSRGPVS